MNKWSKNIPLILHKYLVYVHTSTRIYDEQYCILHIQEMLVSYSEHLCSNILWKIFHIYGTFRIENGTFHEYLTLFGRALRIHEALCKNKKYKNKTKRNDICFWDIWVSA